MTISTGITVTDDVDPEIEGARQIVIEQIDTVSFSVDFQDSTGTSISKILYIYCVKYNIYI